MTRTSLNILIATTHKDISLNYFLDARVTCIYFDDEFAQFKAMLSDTQYDIVYIRDPFNNPNNSHDNLKERLAFITASQPHAYYVDQADNLAKVYIEDKWNQYLLMKQFMPETVIARPHYFIDGKHIAKKRISSRSRDIVFFAAEVPMEKGWIIQEIIPLKEELRVYAVNGIILREASVKMNKTAEKKTKVVGTRQLTDVEYSFMQTVLGELPWIDLVGIDIAVSDKGLLLIEVNRAPQFKRYNEIIGRNIVADFFDQIAEIEA